MANGPSFPSDRPPAGRSVAPDGLGQCPSTGAGPATQSPDRGVCSPDDPACAPGHRIPASSDTKACRECLAAMAHRLAQPMTALRGGIELGLMGKRSAADYRALLEQSLQLADNMAQLIISLRDLGESSAPAARPVRPPEAIGHGSPGGNGEFGAMPGTFICNSKQKEPQGLFRIRSACANRCRVCWPGSSKTAPAGAPSPWTFRRPRVKPAFFLLPRDWTCSTSRSKCWRISPTRACSSPMPPKTDALGWAINQRLLEGLGGKLEMLTDGADAGCIRVRFPLAPAS